jgi:hypothetical protein
VTVPKSFEDLLALESLTIQAKCMEKLPGHLGIFPELKKLNLLDCEQFKTLPECLGKLLGLQTLIIGEGRSLENLPVNFGSFYVAGAASHWL